MRQRKCRLAVRMGADLIVLTGNPGNGVNNGAITSSLREIRKEAGNKIALAAGKMHASGVLEGLSISSRRQISGNLPMREQILFSCLRGDGLQGITTEYIRSLVNLPTVWENSP